jgi:hypothetical protein
MIANLTCILLLLEGYFKFFSLPIIQAITIRQLLVSVKDARGYTNSALRKEPEPKPQAFNFIID